MGTTFDEGGSAPAPPAERFAALWRAAGAAGGPTPPDVFAFLARAEGATPAERLAVILVDQRERWRAGPGRPVEDYLAALPEVAAPDRLAELVQGELAARRGRGEIVDADDFARRFPELRRVLTGQLSRGDIARLADTRDPSLGGSSDPGAAFDLTTQASAASKPGADSLGFPEPRPTRVDDEPPTVASGGTPGDDSLAFSLATGVEFADGPPTEAVPGFDATVRFAVQRRLGAGGMGVVYQAFDRERSELLALKTMRRVDPVALYRFKQEFRTLADLTHPNLVNLYELIAVGDLWFFTMELVPGEDFVSHVRRPPSPPASDFTRPAAARLEPDQGARLRPALRQLAEGLDALHRAGKLHRDVKPRNVLVTPEGRVVLLDFGLSADLGRSGLHHNVEDKVVGTVGYMAPEQAAGQPLSAASDWYSVGVILFESLTGRLPFEGSTDEVFVEKQQSDPPSPGSLTAGVPADLDALCVELLNRDPAARPTGRSVLARLARGEAPAVGDDAPEPEPGGDDRGPPTPRSLIGRERHLDALDAAYNAVRKGRPVLLLVSGRSGSGKSTLLRAFLDRVAGDDGAVVLAGRCYERESVPYKALDSVVDALSRHLKALPTTEAAGLLPADAALLARMFPVLQRVEAVSTAPRAGPESPDGREVRRRAFAALRELLARIGRSTPLVVAVDDLQWGDADNAGLIEDLLRPPDAPPLLFLGSYRTEDADSSALVRALARPSAPPDDPNGSATVRIPAAPPTAAEGLDRRELAVDGLTYAEARGLALSLLGRNDAVARAEAHVVARESHGNPFFVDELVKHVQSGEGLAGRVNPSGSLSLDEVIRCRVGRLPEPARRLLEVVAVSGRPVSLADACLAADLGGEGRAASAALRAARLVRGAGQPHREAVETYHDWVRETIVERLEPAVAARHHLRLAEVLEASGHGDPEALAAHYRGAGRLERAAGDYGRAADKTFETLAFSHAAGLYRRALELRTAADPARPADAEGVRLRTRLGEALASDGRGRDAAREFLDASADPAATAAESLELKRRAAMQLLISGHVDAGLSVLGTVLKARGTSMPRSPAGAFLALARRRAWLRLRGLSFRPRDASRVPAEALSLIDLYWSAGAGLSVIDPVRGADFQARGLSLALRAGEPYRVARALALEASTVSLAGRSAGGRVDDLLARAGAIAGRLDSPHVDGLLDLARGIAALMVGRWQDALAAFGRAEPVFRDRCTGVAWELDTLQNLALWALNYRGDLNELRRRWPVLIREARARGDLYALTTLSTYHMALLRLADDDPERARKETEEAMGRWSHGGYHVQHAAALRALAAASLYRGRAGEALAAVDGEWPKYRRSLLPRIQLVRVQMTEVRARCALGAAVGSADFHLRLREAGRGAESLDREGLGWSAAHAAMLRAGVAAVRGDRQDAAALYAAAAAAYAAADMALNATVARRRRGRLLGGGEGAALVVRADLDLAALGVRDPVRFTALLAPGVFDEPVTDSDLRTPGDDRLT